MKLIKRCLKKMLGEKIIGDIKSRVNNFKSNILLIQNLFLDYKYYKKHSILFNENNFFKKECSIILKYHSIEKGLLHSKIKPYFGKYLIIDLIKLLKEKDVQIHYKRTQIAAALLCICKYYEVHKEMSIDISEYFSEKDYLFFKDHISIIYSSVVEHQYSNFYKNTDSDFEVFSKSRASVRNFTGERIDFSIIENAIELSKFAPSVCNRQASKVYYIENKIQIDKILEIQQGLKGYTQNINQLLILTVDRNYFYSVGERNQMYIDGGIFLMNLLYALHFYKIAACPAHFAHTYKLENALHKLIGLKQNEKVICIIPIGVAENNFKTTLSLRRNIDEFFEKL